MHPLLASSVLHGISRFNFCHIMSNFSSDGMTDGLHTCHSVFPIVPAPHCTVTLQEYTREDVRKSVWSWDGLLDLVSCSTFKILTSSLQ